MVVVGTAVVGGAVVGGTVVVGAAVVSGAVVVGAAVVGGTVVVGATVVGGAVAGEAVVDTTARSVDEEQPDASMAEANRTERITWLRHTRRPFTNRVPRESLPVRA